MKKSFLVFALAGLLSLPSVVLAEASWYGRIDVNWKNAPAGDDKSKSYSGVTSNGSRWGVKGSNELSDGLTAVYQFEAGINAANADTGKDNGRLSYAGLSGGFGTLVVGKVNAAAYGHAGVVVNNGYALGGGPLLGSKLAHAISYATSVGNVSFQVDVQANKTGGNSKKVEGTTMEDKNIDSSQFGATMLLGESGKIALGHVNEDAADKMSNKHSHLVGQYTVGGMTLHLGMSQQKKTDDTHTVKGLQTEYDAQSFSDLATYEKFLAANSGMVKNKKVKTIFYGASGSLGDTGVSYFLEFQNHSTSGKEFALDDVGGDSITAGNPPTIGTYDDDKVVTANVDKNKHTSWTIGLSRSLGTGTAVYLEHSEPDQDKTKATTVLGLQVNF